MPSASAAADRGSSSTPVEDSSEVQGNSCEAEEVGTGGGCEGDDHEDTQDVEVIEGGERKSVAVIQPAIVYTKKGDVVEVEQKVVEAVDGFRVPDGFVRKGSREQSFMYSLGVYVEQQGGVDHKYFCLADAACRRSKKMVPCKKGDRSNVNTHLKTKHGLQGTGGLRKDTKKQEGQKGIRACVDASRNSGVGTNRCVLRAVFLLKVLTYYRLLVRGTAGADLNLNRANVQLMLSARCRLLTPSLFPLCTSQLLCSGHVLCVCDRLCFSLFFFQSSRALGCEDGRGEVLALHLLLIRHDVEGVDRHSHLWRRTVSAANQQAHQAPSGGDVCRHKEGEVFLLPLSSHCRLFSAHISSRSSRLSSRIVLIFQELPFAFFFLSPFISS